MNNSAFEKWKVLDLFSGAGGLSNGFEQTGNFEVFGAVENNEAAAKTYILNHKENHDIILKPETGGLSDITKIEFNRVLEDRGIRAEEAVILGGPPCQGFSNANRQRNQLISGNNLLVKEFARAVYEVRPAAFLMENVKTMNSSAHKFFVQKSIDISGDKSKPSRRRDHLEWLNEHSKESIALNEEERLAIVKIGEEGLDESWAQYLVENYIELIPLLKNESNRSLLRSLERRARKAAAYTPVSSAKKQLDLMIREELKTEDEPWAGFVASAADKIFKPLAEGKPVNLQEHHETLKLLIILNNALTSFQELKENEIEFQNVSADEKNSLIQVFVTTYSVVEYLKVYFRFLGYKLDEGVLTASNFGVPQRRNRFFIMGVLETKAKKDVKLPLPNIKKELTVRDAIVDLENLEPKTDTNEGEIPYTAVSNSPLLKYYRSEMNEDKLYNHVNTDSSSEIKTRYEAIKISKGRNSKDIPELFRNTYSKLENIQNTVYLRLNYEEPSPTVVNVRKSMWSHPEKARAISIREAARLQSFKDSFRFTGKKDSQYQQIGNAVPPLLARAIAEKMLYVLGEEAVNPLEKELESTLMLN